MTHRAQQPLLWADSAPAPKPRPIALVLVMTAHRLTGAPVPLIDAWVRDGCVRSDQIEGRTYVELADVEAHVDAVIDVDVTDLTIHARVIARGVTCR
jgi:hypothetical protein